VTVDRDQQSVQDSLQMMREQLAALRGNAQVLIRRLEHQADGLEPHTDACQTIITQTHLIEIALSRLLATSPHVHEAVTRDA
jgi:nitrogen-specific signal transduction histidine kinase